MRNKLYGTQAANKTEIKSKQNSLTKSRKVYDSCVVGKVPGTPQDVMTHCCGLSKRFCLKHFSTRQSWSGPAMHSATCLLQNGNIPSA
jgi:hypothetical protein